MLKKITGKAITWTATKDMSPDMLNAIEDRIHGLEIDPGVPFIKNNNVRSAFLLDTGVQGCPSLFVKWFKKPAITQRIRYLFVPSKALEEWRNLRALEKHGLPCPQALAFFEKRSCGLLTTSCLIIQGLDGAQPLNAYKTDCTLSSSQKFTLTRQVARLSAAMHSTGVFSRDYHAGNIMVRLTGEKNFELFLIDLHKARIVKKIKNAMIITDLAKLSNSFPLSRMAKLRFAREYYLHASVSMPLAEFLRRIMEKSARIQTRRIISRSKRCVLKSSVFEIARTWSERYCGRRDFGHAAANAVITQHLNTCDGQTIIKKTSKSILSTHVLNQGGSVCVKGYRYRGLCYALLNMFRKSRALKSWVNANGFIVRGLLTPQPLAMIEKRWGSVCRENFYICRWQDKAPELNNYITGRQWPLADKKNFIRCLATTIIKLHAQGIYHGDLKSNNILVQENKASWDFLFIDLDRVSFTRELTFDRRANNLAQINASISNIMTLRDRLRFFRFYSEAADCYTDRKRYYRRILEITRTKGTESYGLHLGK